MANKFTKSVLERQQRQEPLSEQPEQKAEARLDLAACLTATRAARNKTYYLDESVIAAVHAAARQQKVADSRLVNAVLRQVLGVSDEK